MAIELVFETHCTTVDNEQGHATGWQPGQLWEPYPRGESWRAATARAAGFLDDLFPRWDGRRVLVVGHVATRWALNQHVGGVPLEKLIDQDFAWQEGWPYRLIASALPSRARTADSARRSSASIAGSGSTAMTSAPSATSVAVSLPVPAPRSSTRGPGAGSSAQRTAACA